MNSIKFTKTIKIDGHDYIETDYDAPCTLNDFHKIPKSNCINDEDIDFEEDEGYSITSLTCVFSGKRKRMSIESVNIYFENPENYMRESNECYPIGIVDDETFSNFEKMHIEKCVICLDNNKEKISPIILPSGPLISIVIQREIYWIRESLLPQIIFNEMDEEKKVILLTNKTFDKIFVVCGETFQPKLTWTNPPIKNQNYSVLKFSNYFSLDREQQYYKNSIPTLKFSEARSIHKMDAQLIDSFDETEYFSKSLNYYVYTDDTFDDLTLFLDENHKFKWFKRIENNHTQIIP